MRKSVCEKEREEERETPEKKETPSLARQFQTLFGAVVYGS